MKKIYLLFALTILLMSGCIIGFDRDAAERRLADVNLDNVDANPNLMRMPLKVAVFADLENMSSSGEFDETWDWSSGDKNLIISYLDNLVELKYLSEYVIIPDDDISQQDINVVIEKAQALNADALLTLRGVIKVNKYFNPAAILDLTIIGACLFPGSNREAFLIVYMNLWNVKEKDCVLTVKGEGTKKISEPTFLIDTQDAVDSVKRDTLRKILAEFKKRCREIKPAN
ncbi:MAG TPA: hypothetical protein DCZ94_10955 [Lentisphaeria bacterium]|nr:MAG: hypothetical protein A2X48_06835 [Lentisphaerae bacterium GWF2_49_21]HBC87464.1 hypothetical protein [Lentisphaeria bacterium]